MKYKHALFLNPYVESASTSFMGLFPPTGLEYVATNAKGFVDKVTLMDLRYEKELCDPGKLSDFMQREGIDVICAAIGWDRQFEKVRDFLNLMPDDIPLIVGGYKATERVEEILRDCPTVDIVVRGEGEETIKEIFKGIPLDNIPGISYRKDNRVIHSANRSLPDVNTLHDPDRSLRRNKYRMKLHGIDVTSMSFDCVLSARGCPYTCKFCTFGLNPLGQKRTYAARTPESVIEEIEKISADVILFSDDNFCVDAKRAERICDLLIERGIKKSFTAQVRIDIAKYPRLLAKMAKIGFKMLLVGVESPHDHILAQLNKGFDSNAVRRAFAVLKKYPIFYHAYFIYGNIGESEEEMMRIPEFAKEIKADSITCTKLRADKFSPLRELAKKTPGYHVTDRGEVYSDMYSHPALKRIAKRMKFSFYTPLRLLKISWKVIAIKLFSPREIMSFVIASPALLKSVIAREIEKNRLGESLRRIFIHNAR